MDATPNLLQQLFDALDARNYLVAVPLIVLGVIWFVRLFLRRVPKIGAWIASDAGGAVFGILGAVAQGVLVAAALPGEHKPSQVIVAVVGFLFVNQTFFVSLKKLGVDLSVDPVKPGFEKGPAMPPGSTVSLLLVVALVLPGCLHLKEGAKTKLIQCGTDVMQAEVQGVMPDVAKALQGTAVDWQPQLDQLVARVGGAALCALAVLVANLEVGGGAGAGLVEPVAPRYPDSVLLMRAYAYQAAHPYQLE